MPCFVAETALGRASASVPCKVLSHQKYTLNFFFLKQSWGSNLEGLQTPMQKPYFSVTPSATQKVSFTKTRILTGKFLAQIYGHALSGFLRAMPRAQPVLWALGACCKPCTIWQDSRAEPALKYGAWLKHDSEGYKLCCQRTKFRAGLGDSSSCQ